MLLIRNRSGILTIHKARILRKKLLEKSVLTFKEWVEKIQTAGYNGARRVHKSRKATYVTPNTTRNLVAVLSCLNILHTFFSFSHYSVHTSYKSSRKKSFFTGSFGKPSQDLTCLAWLFVSQLRLLHPRGCIRHAAWINAQCKRIFTQ